jgi:hypothetical protein
MKRWSSAGGEADEPDLMNALIMLLAPGAIQLVSTGSRKLWVEAGSSFQTKPATPQTRRRIAAAHLEIRPKIPV